MLLNVEIVTEYPLWFSVLCLAAGFLYSWLLYRKEKAFEQVPAWTKRLMAAFRFLTVSIIAFLLLSPLLKRSSTTVEKPLIIIGQDISSSLAYGADSAYYQKEYRQKMEGLKERLDKEYSVEAFSFDGNVKEGMSYAMDGKQTDISAFLREMDNRFVNRNVGAMIIASDGIYNKGRNPLYSGMNFNFPVYTIALGDTNVRKDLVLSEVRHNSIAYLGNKFPLEAVISAKKCAGENSVLKVYHNGEAIFSKPFEVKGDDFYRTEQVLLEAKETGLQKYRVMVTEVEGEVSEINNYQDIYIDVLDSRKKVLVLARAPHPDIKAIRAAVESKENYRVDVELAKEYSGGFDEYSLVVLHQIPSGQQKNMTDQLIKKIEAAGVSSLYVLGARTDVNAFNKLNTGLQIQNNRLNMNAVQPVYNESFSLFDLDKPVLKTLPDLPPLSSPFGKYITTDAFYALFNQQIGMVETSEPLVMFAQSGERKTGVIAGEGLWRWRLAAYSLTGSHEVFNELMGKVVRYMSVEADKSRFRLSSKNSFYENEAVTFEAELYNESYELTNKPEISIKLVDEEGNEYPFVFSKTSKSYFLDAGIFPVGEYSYEAKVTLGDKQLTETGTFTVKNIQVESVNTIADHQLLHKLSSEFGGEMFYPGQIAALENAIKSKEEITSVAYSDMSYHPVIDVKWIFFLVLALLTAEWFMRKRNGAY